MLRLGLTGGIATGKTHCAAAFARLGVPLIDADRLAREVVEPGTPGLDAIVERFGRGVLTETGDLDRRALGRIVFGDGKARAELEAIIHPEVYRRVRDWFPNLPKGTRLALADIPLLFESGHQHDFDRVIVCACGPDEQIRRVILRDRLTEAEARARLDAQWPIAEKVSRADRVIWTDRSFAETEAQVKTIYELLDAEAY